MRKCDILIIGAGIAGVTAALELGKKGLDVVLLSAGDEPNSAWAQGGIVTLGDADSPSLLTKDILDAGSGLCNLDAIAQLVRLGPHLVDTLLKPNVPFDAAHTLEAAHSTARILHCKDKTGFAIMRALSSLLPLYPNIEIRPHSTAVDLITLSHHSLRITDIYLPSTCVGAYVFNNASVQPIFARETILATGGLGEVYLHTTNPPDARGDGIAMAYRAGARIMNMEYIQFHPTALYIPGERRFLLSEALRGEGARILNARFQPFLDELAPRDIVSRAIFTEMLNTSSDHLWLDITHKSRSHLQSRFPAIYQYCLEKNLDPATTPLPIVPAAHYSCGGVAADLNGKTTIHRLRAIGEVSCTGLHGANRLASTSLLEGLVWAHTAATDILSTFPRNDPFPQIQDWQMSTNPLDLALVRQDWIAIKQTMWNYVGLVRDQDRLRRALKMLRELQWEIDSFYEKATLTPELIGLRNGALTSLLIAQGAWRNKHSLGCHFRIN
jgi:L-aspartate oxidase